MSSGYNNNDLPLTLGTYRNWKAVYLRMLKIGVFGTGHLGKFHLNNWKEIPGVEVVGFYDPEIISRNRGGRA